MKKMSKAIEVNKLRDTVKKTFMINKLILEIYVYKQK